MPEKQWSDAFDLERAKPIIAECCRRFLPKFAGVASMSLDDLVQEGVIVCACGHAEFDPRKAEYSTFVNQRVFRRLTDLLRTSIARSKREMGIGDELRRTGAGVGLVAAAGLFYGRLLEAGARPIDATRATVGHLASVCAWSDRHGAALLADPELQGAVGLRRPVSHVYVYRARKQCYRYGTLLKWAKHLNQLGAEKRRL